MECKRSAFLTIFILSFIFGQSFAARADIPHRSVPNADVVNPTVEEDWVPIFNLNDPHLVSIAQFAVDEHNRRDSDRITLIAIAGGEQLRMDNMIWKLVIVGKDFSKFDAPTLDYHVEVYENLSGGQKALLSFIVTTSP